MEKLSDSEAYVLAKQLDPKCIPHLMKLIQFSAIEILRLEAERDKALQAAMTKADPAFLSLLETCFTCMGSRKFKLTANKK